MSSSHIHGGISQRLESVAAPRVRQIVGVVAFAVLTALSARLSVLIPGTQIPFTFQPLAVLLTGALLGARLGAASQATYLLAGLAGLPVFAMGTILAPSGGYLMAYPVAAFVVGALVGKGWLTDLFGLVAGLGVIYLGGFAWLSLSIGPEAAFLAGVMPFVLPDLVKVGLAMIVARRIGRESRALFGA